ncbi:hypothetical protein U1Q18_019209 [Sarracenia purpurea var. burkii]
MHPALIHGHLFWFILSGYIFLLVLSLGPQPYRGSKVESENPLTFYSGSLLHNTSDISTSIHFQTSGSSSLLNDSVSCEDLEGVGSFNTTCLLNSNLYLNSDLYVYGTGNLKILPNISIVCPVEGCLISLNLSGNIKVCQYAAVVAGSIVISAANLTMGHMSYINTTSLGGSPPSQTSGTPVGYDGAGGGHGGRGASCLKSNRTNYWGGDVYAWSTLSKPWSYGSKGGGTSARHQFGGRGGGRVMIEVKDMLFLNGSVTAEGGDGGPSGGGGSGGSIIIHSLKLFSCNPILRDRFSHVFVRGYGTISAAGGRGWGGGGGGRISLNCYSKQEDVKATVHGQGSTKLQIIQLGNKTFNLVDDSGDHALRLVVVERGRNLCPSVVRLATTVLDFEKTVRSISARCIISR